MRVEKQADYHNKNKTEQHFNMTCMMLSLVKSGESETERERSKQ